MLSSLAAGKPGIKFSPSKFTLYGCPIIPSYILMQSKKKKYNYGYNKKHVIVVYFKIFRCLQRVQLERLYGFVILQALFQYKLSCHWFLLSTLSYRNPIQHNQVLMSLIISIAPAQRPENTTDFTNINMELMKSLGCSSMLFLVQEYTSLLNSTEGTNEAFSIWKSKQSNV